MPAKLNARDTVFIMRLADAVEPLARRLDVLEQRSADGGFNYRGVWRQGEAHARGAFCTHDGSLWRANEDTASRPGTDRTWTLAVKRGRDGDERRTAKSSR
jgi:hypothetical protein